MIRHRHDMPEENQALSEINMVPLIDVMLVLLVIFIIAVPLMTHVVRIELPQANSMASTSPQPRVQLEIDATGNLYWNNEPVPPTEFSRRLEQAARQNATTELRIHADRRTPYDNVAKVMAMAASHVLGRIGFVSDPEH